MEEDKAKIAKISISELATDINAGKVESIAVTNDDLSIVYLNPEGGSKVEKESKKETQSSLTETLSNLGVEKEKIAAVKIENKFDIGVCIRQVKCSVDSHFERVKMFELGKFELSRFNVPAEFMCPADSWEDWKSPLTKHITLGHLQPGILISSSVDGDTKSVQVSMSIRNLGPGNNSISTNTGILKLIP